jgi:hypothetical protein
MLFKAHELGPQILADRLKDGPIQQRLHWQYAGELLTEAADHRLGLTDAWAQLRRALIVEGLI